VEWPSRFYALKRGEGCPMCEQGRPDETPYGIRFFAGEVTDAYLHRGGVQRGLSHVYWRGRHVVVPTELEPEESALSGTNCCSPAARSSASSHR
jgi:hypothetical protein